MTAAVLVVDDDQDSRELLADILRHRGFDVNVSESGDACLELIEGVHGDISVVLTDVEMPGMTGIELCREIHTRYPDIIAIVMSGRATAAVATEVKSAGATAFLPKPVNIDQLERLLRKLETAAPT